VRTLLDLMRENGASVQENLMHCQNLLQQATRSLKVLDPEFGEEELVKSVAAELAKVTALIARSSQRE
jgi:hypothetical protein